MKAGAILQTDKEKEVYEMNKRRFAIIITLIMMLTLAGCGGRSGNGGGTVDSGQVDPFDPAIFNVESGGIVFHYTVDFSVYAPNRITEITIENQLPESDIRSTFTYEVVEAEDSTYSDALLPGDKVGIEVTAPDEFWEDHDMTATTMDFTIPPVPYTLCKSSLVTEEIMSEHLPEISTGLKEVIEGNYNDWISETTGSVKDLIETDNIYIEGSYVTAKAKEPDEEGQTRYVELGLIIFTYNENNELVATFCHETVDESNEFYFLKNEDHLIPATDDTSWIVSIDGDGPWVDDLSPSDRYLHLQYTYAEPEAEFIYNYNTGTLTSLK